MLELIDDLSKIRAEQIPAVLCIVVFSSGSTPRKAGSKMIVYRDGAIKGTIGGGGIEFQVIQDALRMFESGNAVIRHFELQDDVLMTCGGTMDIYFEPIGLMPELIIFGGGHVGRALAGYASGLGFLTRVIDQRKDIFADWDIPGTETIVGDYLEFIENLKFHEHTFLVITTPQHEFDEKVLIACAPRQYAYLGMIGSKKKVAEISKRADEFHRIGPDILNKIDMPIGIPFAAETPAEIAISIVAKLIDVKNKLKKA